MTFSCEIRLGPIVWGAGLHAYLWRHEGRLFQDYQLIWRFWSLEGRVWGLTTTKTKFSYGFSVSYYNPRRSTHECESDCNEDVLSWTSFGRDREPEWWHVFRVPPGTEPDPDSVLSL